MRMRWCCLNETRNFLRSFWTNLTYNSGKDCFQGGKDESSHNHIHYFRSDTSVVSDRVANESISVDWSVVNEASHRCDIFIFS